MKLENQKFAEKVLKYLLIGSQVDGIKFGLDGSTTILYFTNYSRKEDDAFCLNIETAWTVYPASCDKYPLSEAQVPTNTEEQHFKYIWDIRREKVVNVQLDTVSPHLIISLESGKVLFVNGHDANYECWQLGDHFAGGNCEWLLVATPGGNIEAWSPEHFE
ncbi:hypothetical protein COD13_30565 [Priestia megaterium]|uniref:hypothetical protein n=1 Tax=Priestia megaterium TaxID=1404 RepID=UPI000BFB6FDC|nr:hypothetical protein [Priestia megaterium]PGR19014.1 hypothetical protein COC52_27515 [Priestia megaterium]PGR78568.1 hypothetical protein COC53_27825 [Priestia megaterium]PGT48530.1 hypothetical protein COD13_30565 [Priestia megaterium]